MRCLLTTIITLFLALTIFTGFGLADTQDELLATLEQKVVERINRLRAEPLQAAADLGLDPLQVLADFPLMADELERGLPPLMRQPILEFAADAHTQDMFARSYYDTLSPDGTTPEARMIAAGYNPKLTAERLGALTFINFIPTEEVLDLILEKMFKEEFDPDYPDHLTFLDPDLKEIGVGLGTGKMLLEERLYQACLLTLDMGSPVIAPRGADALRALINQARSDAAAAVVTLGYDPESIIESRPHLALAFEGPLPPLRNDDNLTQSAYVHVTDMAALEFFSHTGSDGTTPQDRAAAAGYGGEQVSERLSRFTLTHAVNVNDVAAYFFRRMFIAELNAPEWADRVILNPDISDVGISMEPGTVENTSGGFDHLLLAAVTGGRSKTVSATGIVGVVYRDRDGDGRYAPGEAMAGSAISIQGFESMFGNAVSVAAIADSAGGFAVTLPSATLGITIAPPDGESAYLEINTGWEARWLGIALN